MSQLLCQLYMLLSNSMYCQPATAVKATVPTAFLANLSASQLQAAYARTYELLVTEANLSAVSFSTSLPCQHLLGRKQTTSPTSLNLISAPGSPGSSSVAKVANPRNVPRCGYPPTAAHMASAIC